MLRILICMSILAPLLTTRIAAADAVAATFGGRDGEQLRTRLRRLDTLAVTYEVAENPEEVFQLARARGEMRCERYRQERLIEARAIAAGNYEQFSLDHEGQPVGLVRALAALQRQRTGLVAEGRYCVEWALGLRCNLTQLLDDELLAAARLDRDAAGLLRLRWQGFGDEHQFEWLFDPQRRGALRRFRSRSPDGLIEEVQVLADLEIDNIWLPVEIRYRIYRGQARSETRLSLRDYRLAAPPRPLSISWPPGTEIVRYAVDSGFLGLQLDDGDDGVVITDVIQGSPAAIARLAPGMVIVAIDQQRLRSHDLRRYVAGRHAGDTVQLTIRNNADVQTVAVPLAGIANFIR